MRVGGTSIEMEGLKFEVDFWSITVLLLQLHFLFHLVSFNKRWTLLYTKI